MSSRKRVAIKKVPLVQIALAQRCFISAKNINKDFQQAGPVPNSAATIRPLEERSLTFLMTSVNLSSLPVPQPYQTQRG